MHVTIVEAWTVIFRFWLFREVALELTEREENPVASG